MFSAWGRSPLEEPVAVASLVVLCLLATALDASHRRIPNYLTYSFAALGLSMHLAAGRLGSGMLGLFVGMAVLYPAFRSRKLGGGDVKLMGAIGAIGGFPFVVEAMLYGFIFAAAMAVGTVLSSSRLRETFYRVFNELGGTVGLWPPSSSTIDSDDALDRIPLGIGLSAGAIAAMVDRQYHFFGWVDPLYYLVHRMTS